jgi:hypothetical protein
MESSATSDNIRSEVEDLKGKVNEMSSTMKNIESLLSSFVLNTPIKPKIKTSTSSLTPPILASGLKDDVDLVDEEAKIDGDNDEDKSNSDFHRFSVILDKFLADEGVFEGPGVKQC